MPGMTMTEQILAKHSGKTHVEPGENIWVDVDVLMTHDVCGPGTIGVFHEKFGKNSKVWDPNKVVIIPDHYIFTADQKCHRNVQILRDFVREQGLKYYYDPEFVTMDPSMPSPYKGPTKTNYKGVCHKALPEEGHVRPGEILLGTDSHTCTAGAFGQFATGIGNTDAGFVLGTGKLWLKVPPTMKFTFRGEIPAYFTEHEWDLSTMEPMVAKPHSPDNKDTAHNCRDVKIDRAYIGSCTGGKITDMIFAANILKGNTVKVKTFVVPGSTEVHADMKRLNLRGVPKDLNEKSIEEVLLDSGCLVGPSGCSACLGGPADTFGRLQGTEVCISTTNRNFPGRMGSKNSAVFLASPLTVAASALTGHVTDPREYVSAPIETGMAGVL